MSKLNGNNLRKAIRYCKKNGPVAMLRTISERMHGDPYRDYTYERPEGAILEAQRKCVFDKSIEFSIVVPCYETDRAYLRELIQSVLDQSYENWELILADASTTDSVRETQAEFTDSRIRYVRLAENNGISENTNAGLLAATGDYIALLDHDDVLTPDALYRMRAAVEECNTAPVFLFSDEDKTDETGKRFYEPNIKLDLNYDLIMTNNYVCHFLAVRRQVMTELKLRKEYDGAQDYDLVLRLLDYILEHKLATPATIGTMAVHVPCVLYHWRCHSNSTAANPESKMYAYEAGLRAVQACMERRGYRNAVAVHAEHLGYYRVEHDMSTLWQDRPEIGAVGGPIYRRGKQVAGAMNCAGELLWPGAGKHSSGYMNRISSIQDVPALHMDNLLVRTELAEGFLKKYGSKFPGIRLADSQGADETVRFICDDKGGFGPENCAASLAFAEYLAEEGYLILYMPEFDVKK